MNCLRGFLWFGLIISVCLLLAPLAWAQCTPDANSCINSCSTCDFYKCVSGQGQFKEEHTLPFSMFATDPKCSIANTTFKVTNVPFTDTDGFFGAAGATIKALPVTPTKGYFCGKFQTPATPGTSKWVTQQFCFGDCGQRYINWTCEATCGATCTSPSGKIFTNGGSYTGIDANSLNTDCGSCANGSTCVNNTCAVSCPPFPVINGVQACDCWGNIDPCICMTSNCNSGGPTTPFLFALSSGKYFIENDVMHTYSNKYYETAKEQYENNSGDPFEFRRTDLYKLNLTPDLTQEGIKLRLSDLEPEESQIDQVSLKRVIASQEAYVFIDWQNNEIKAVKPKKMDSASSCYLNKDTDCLQSVNGKSTQIEINKGDQINAEFNLQGVDQRNLYLVLGSWTRPSPDGTWRNDIVVNVITEGKTTRLKDIHSRDIKSRMELGLGQALKGMHGNKLVIELQSMGHHWIDYIGLMETIPMNFKTESLSLNSAIESNGRDVTKQLRNLDKDYAHTVRGDSVDLVFSKPGLVLKQGQSDAYVFIASGFYHSLRTSMYPHVDPSFVTFEQELNKYLGQLKEVSDH